MEGNMRFVALLPLTVACCGEGDVYDGNFTISKAGDVEAIKH